jgi:hypothetical protein
VKSRVAAAGLILGAGLAVTAAVPAAAAASVRIIYTNSTSVLTCQKALYEVTGNKVVQDVQNGCPVRVWLYQGTGGSGPSYCISPRTSRVPPAQFRQPKSIFVSANTAGCTPA